MKTIKEWFDQLPQPQRHEAINNVINQHSPEHLTANTFSLSNALRISFSWEDTDEGFLYWFKINIEAIKKELDENS